VEHLTTEHGGRRKGAGRPLAHEAHKVKRSVTLSPRAWAIVDAYRAQHHHRSVSETLEAIVRQEQTMSSTTYTPSPDLFEPAGLTVHWHGMAIGEFTENDRTVFVPAWANGCLNRASIATTPRFATLAEAKVAVDSMFQCRLLEQHLYANQRAEREAATPAPVRAIVSGDGPDNDDPAVCWECGLPIAAGEGVIDEPMGWAHRSCVGA